MKTFYKVVFSVPFVLMFCSAFYYIMVRMGDISLDPDLPLLYAFATCMCTAWFIHYMWKD